MRRSSCFVVVCAALLLGNVHAEETDSKCSYCLATAEVLGKRVENERPRNHIDLRHRVDKEGTRYGKILDFRLSELRIFELLDNLSSDLESYTPVHTQDSGTTWFPNDSAQSKNVTIPKHELKQRRGLLKRWCETTIEVHEDAITDLLRSDSLSKGGIQDVLCKKLTRACEVNDQKEEL